MDDGIRGYPSQKGRIALDRYLREIGRDDGPKPFRRFVDSFLYSDMRGLPVAIERFQPRDPPPASDRKLSVSDANSVFVGMIMESTEFGLKAITGEVKSALETLSEVSNEIGALSDVVAPKLQQQIRDIREHKMTIVRELREVLVTLREVRKFFLESDYETEVARLERFVRLCRELEALKAAGVLDAVCDSAIRLALKEPSA
jgi:hypothetical protein